MNSWQQSKLGDIARKDKYGMVDGPFGSNLPASEYTDTGVPIVRGVEQLQSIDGIGPAKATTILAAFEFARRRIRPEGFKIGLPPDVLPLIQHMADRKQEHFLCISLNGAYEVIAVRTVSVGLVNKTQVHPREVFAGPIPTVQQPSSWPTTIPPATSRPAKTISPSPAS
jgi:hypothetical protein